jgi:DNA-binding HxlR family transcriptional regulator
MAGRIGRQSSVASRQSVAGRQSSRAGQEPRPAKHEATNLDRVIHERMRLAIVSALAVNDTLTFNDLKRLLETTDGNLSVHARKLEDAHYITCEKSFEGRMPKTEFKLTAAGRKAFVKS